MSLTLAYNIARGALATGAATGAVLSRNIANAGNSDAARKTTLVATGIGGVPYVANTVNEVNRALLERTLESASASSELETIAHVWQQLAALNGDPQMEMSPAAQIAAFREALQTSSSAPHDMSALQGVLTSASAVVAGLNDAADLVDRIRAEANVSLGEAVGELQSLLQAFGEVNNAIVSASGDSTDQIDQRNTLVRSIAQLVAIRTVSTEDNGLALYLASGATLFETSGRELSIVDTVALIPGQPGPNLRIDGVPLKVDSEIGGRIGGLLVARDVATLQLGRQLDEIARGLIMATAERDQSAAPVGQDLAGLFTYAGGPMLPPIGSVYDGLAGSIKVNPNADPAKGGALARIRDGGISDPGNPSYIYNTTSGASYGARLLGLVENLEAGQPIDTSVGLSVSPVSVLKLAATSAGWLEGERSATQGRHEAKKVLTDRALAAWQSSVGVNLDDELTALMSLERSYQASTRLINAVNVMFDSLLAATR